MPKFNKWDEEDDLSSSFDKIPNKKRDGKGKGHQSQHQKRQVADAWEPWTEKMDEVLMQEFKTQSRKETDYKPRIQEKTNQPSKAFNYSEYTREINGIKIDYMGVLNIEKVDSMFKDRLTFGIKFNFKGLKNPTRTIWFSGRLRERDRVFEEENNYWVGVQAATHRK